MNDIYAISYKIIMELGLENFFLLNKDVAFQFDNYKRLTNKNIIYNATHASSDFDTDTINKAIDLLQGYAVFKKDYQCTFYGIIHPTERLLRPGSDYRLSAEMIAFQGAKTILYQDYNLKTDSSLSQPDNFFIDYSFSSGPFSNYRVLSVKTQSLLQQMGSDPHIIVKSGHDFTQLGEECTLMYIGRYYSTKEEYNEEEVENYINLVEQNFKLGKFYIKIFEDSKERFSPNYNLHFDLNYLFDIGNYKVLKNEAYFIDNAPVKDRGYLLKIFKNHYDKVDFQQNSIYDKLKINPNSGTFLTEIIITEPIEENKKINCYIRYGIIYQSAEDITDSYNSQPTWAIVWNQREIFWTEWSEIEFLHNKKIFQLSHDGTYDMNNLTDSSVEYYSFSFNPNDLSIQIENFPLEEITKSFIVKMEDNNVQTFITFSEITTQQNESFEIPIIYKRYLNKTIGDWTEWAKLQDPSEEDIVGTYYEDNE